MNEHRNTPADILTDFDRTCWIVPVRTGSRSRPSRKDLMTVSRRQFLAGAAGVPPPACSPAVVASARTTRPPARSRASSPSPPGRATPRRARSRSSSRPSRPPTTAPRSTSRSCRTARCSPASTPSSRPGTAPDVFRVDYPTMGRYSSQNQLLDLTGYLDSLTDDFIPALYQAVSTTTSPSASHTRPTRPASSTSRRSSRRRHHQRPRLARQRLELGGVRRRRQQAQGALRGDM